VSISVAAVELEPNTGVVFTNSGLSDEDTNISFDDLSEEDRIFFKKLTLVLDGYKTNEAGEIIFTYSTDDLYKFGFNEKEIERLNELNKMVCGTVLPDSDRIPMNPVQSRIFVKDWKVWFTCDDVANLLLTAASLGPEALYITIVGLSTAVGGAVGTVLSVFIDAIGIPSLGGLCYLIIQAVANHQGIYFGLEMNGVFPTVDCGTW